jgi:tetratricopeptide (TPR) repeat protein
LQERGTDVATALLLEYYTELPEQMPGESSPAWTQRYRAALEQFQQRVEQRYNEGTLQRLLDASHVPTRQAAVLALGMCGSMQSNRTLAGMLHDDDATVRQLATEAMWSVWFRAAAPEHQEELQRLVGLASSEESDPDTLRAGFDALIRQVPTFAEAYNQRAIFHFHRGDYAKAIKDCERTLKLNPQHFGAAGGLAQCYLKQRKLRPALRAYRRSFRINPNLDGVRQAIQSLEKTLGEEGKR